MARGHNRTRINREWVPKGRHERLYAVDCCVRRTRRGPGAGTGCEKMATPSHPGDRHRASTRAALVTGSMPDAPTWTEPGEDTGGRSFPRKPRTQKPHRAQRGPRPAPGEAKRITGATRRKALRAAPGKRSQTRPRPQTGAKKRPATAGHEGKRCAIRTSVDSEEPAELGAAAPGRVNARSPATSPCP